MSSTNPEREVLSSIASTGAHGRVFAIAELLRLGWSVAAVSNAVRHADARDIEGALNALLSSGRPERNA